MSHTKGGKGAGSCGLSPAESDSCGVFGVGGISAIAIAIAREKR